MLFSKSTRGFYDPDINRLIPDDAIEIDRDAYLALIGGQSEGKLIAVDAAGVLVLSDQPPPSQNEIIIGQISALERQQTPRRLRECSLGTDGGWLANIDAQISALRNQLV